MQWKQIIKYKWKLFYKGIDYTSISYDYNNQFLPFLCYDV